jgi:hypothetical protein
VLLQLFHFDNCPATPLDFNLSTQKLAFNAKREANMSSELRERTDSAGKALTDVKYPLVDTLNGSSADGNGTAGNSDTRDTPTDKVS